MYINITQHNTSTYEKRGKTEMRLIFTLPQLQKILILIQLRRHFPFVIESDKHKFQFCVSRFQHRDSICIRKGLDVVCLKLMSLSASRVTKGRPSIFIYTATD